jgi:hypothetical protein
MADTKTAGYDASTGEFTPPDGYTLSTTGTWKGNVYLRYASTTAGSDDLVYTLPGMVGKTFTINGTKTVVLDHELRTVRWPTRPARSSTALWPMRTR